MAEKYVSLERLTQYDGLIKNYINTADAKAFKTAKFDDATRKLKLFKAESPADDATADFEVVIPETDVSGLLAKLTGVTEGDVVIANADGTVKDSGVKLADLALKSEVSTVSDLVGTIPDGYDAITIAEYAKELADNVAANGYDDTEVKGLIQDNTDDITELGNRVTTVEGSITTMFGSDTGKSVRTIANEELAKQLIAENASESLDTLEEIAAWIQSHPNDASAMSKAIDDLEALVGTIPEDATANTIVGYIDELIAQVKGSVKEVKSGTTNGTIAVDGTDVAVTGLGSAAYKSDTDFDSSGSANAAEVNSKAYADTLNTAMDTRVTALEDATPIAITEDEISNLFS
ncbi:MAG: hypothetical protein IJA10_10415 [Lachnospiraceae bacterium]|nr:hypothetical protein [Lachnospiraceae bacterium]